MNAAIPFLAADNCDYDAGPCPDDPELWLSPHRTTALLRRYLHMSIDIGRVPSLLGREFFRSRVTSYRMSTFEDAVIFVHDVETSIDRLDTFSQQLIARVVLQEYTEVETGRLLHTSLRTVQRLLPEAIDQLSAVLLRGGLLTPFPKPPRKACQYDKKQQSLSTHCHCGK